MNLWKTEGWSFRVLPFLVIALIVTITLAWGCTETDPKSRRNASVTDAPQV